jgi:hypothetical protein
MKFADYQKKKKEQAFLLQVTVLTRNFDQIKLSNELKYSNAER